MSIQGRAQTSEAGSSVQDPQVSGLGAKIARTAALDLVVADGGFEKAWGRVNAVASKYAGQVSDSNARRTDEGLSTGTITVRVPAGSFTDALDELRELGETEALEVSSQDVTGSFVDLDARLRTLETQEQSLLEILTQATSIDETLTVRDRIDRVRGDIERLRGERAVLADRVDLATIHMSVSAEREEADEAAPADADPGVWERLGLAQAADRALDGAAGVVRGLIVFAGYAIPLGLIAALIYIGYRSTRSRRYALAGEKE